MFLKDPGNRAGVAAALTIVWALILMWKLSPYPFPHIFPYNINSPVLALELSHNASDIKAVLHRTEPQAPLAAHVMWVGNLLDLVFIPIYAFFLWSVARVFANRLRLLTAVILGTALFDYLEDWQIFRALDGANPAIYIPSLVKWGLLGLALLLTGIMLLRSVIDTYSLPTRRLLAVGYLASGGLMIASVALGQWIGYSYIELGLEIFGLLAIVHTIGLLGPHFSIAGISQTYVENFCEERKRGASVAVKPERR
jgi:hypothetical protein